MSRSPFTKAERAAKAAECLARLRDTIHPGDRFYTVLTHRSASGMSRRFKLLRPSTRTVTLDGAPNVVPTVESCAFDVAMALGLRLDFDTHEITMPGCGYDAGFEVIYQLGRALWPEGTPEPHGHRNGAPDRDGGYALRHEWL